MVREGCDVAVSWCLSLDSAEKRIGIAALNESALCYTAVRFPTAINVLIV